MNDEVALKRLEARRQFIKKAAAGTALTVLGSGAYLLSDSFTDEAKAQRRSDGRPRLPPGQRAIGRLKPMGGIEGEPGRGAFQLHVHGEVDRPVKLGFSDLLAMNPIRRQLDVHCVTGWSLLGSSWTGVPIRALAERVGARRSARHVILEAFAGYEANLRIDDALDQNAMIVWELDGEPLRRANGAPVRALVPDLYFWKSAKWLTGIRFVKRDRPGYWESRGYHNRANPWNEERHA